RSGCCDASEPSGARGSEEPGRTATVSVPTRCGQATPGPRHVLLRSTMTGDQFGLMSSAEVVEGFGKRLADPRDERGLLLRVSPCLGVAQAADAVDQLIELVGLEAEDPFPVAQSE